MALTSEIDVTREGFVTTVRLNNPDKLNALSHDSILALGEIFASLATDEETRAVIVTGTGRGFCGGANLGGLLQEAEKRTRTTYPRFCPHDVGLFKPIIVAVNGVCAGAGLHFVSGGDIIIASSNATFVDPHTSNGQVSALEAIGLVRRAPMSPILRMIILGGGERMTAARALEIGMITEVVEPEHLMTRAMEIAALASEPSPAAIQGSLRAIWGSLELPLQEAYDRGYEFITAHRDHPDAAEGARAFLERRPPRWTPGIRLPDPR